MTRQPKKKNGKTEKNFPIRVPTRPLKLAFFVCISFFHFFLAGLGTALSCCTFAVCLSVRLFCISCWQQSLTEFACTDRQHSFVNGIMGGTHDTRTHALFQDAYTWLFQECNLTSAKDIKPDQNKFPFDASFVILPGRMVSLTLVCAVVALMVVGSAASPCYESYDSNVSTLYMMIVTRSSRSCEMIRSLPCVAWLRGPWYETSAGRSSAEATALMPAGRISWQR